MNEPTRSEALFEQLCELRRVPFERVDPGPGKTPDYEVSLGGASVLVEIKQIDPNAADNAMAAKAALHHTAHMYREPLGARLRGKVSVAARQLRQSIAPGQPALVVLFNNVSAVRSFTDSTNIMAALYGSLEFVLARAPNGSAEFVDQRLGGGRKLTPQHNTAVSAVCVLFEGPDAPYLVGYHNHFAAAPLGPQSLRQLCEYQFVLGPKEPGSFPEWLAV